MQQSHPYALYLQASDEFRRRLNQAIFKRIWVIDADRVESELTEPARLLVEAQRYWVAEQAAENKKSQDSRPGPVAEPLDESLETMDLALVSSKPSMSAPGGTRILGRARRRRFGHLESLIRSSFSIT